MVGGHATVGRLSNNVFWTFQAIKRILEKVTERSRDSSRRSRDRRPTVKQRFLDVSSDLRKFWKKSLNGHATVVGGHATVGRLSNNDFSTFQAIRIFFWKESLNGHATVGRLSNNVFWAFQAIWENFEKVAERSRDSGWGHATVGRLSNNVFWTFQDFFQKNSNCLKRRKIVDWQSADSRLTSDHCRVTVKRLFSKFSQIARNVQKTLFDSRPTVAWPPTTVAWPFSDFFQKFS